ncbi:MAG: helix-turn-helix domain-containing protein [Ruminococcaceae bacterium]|nr:helix-turn-helix domain-containing protein [Oscillospiraceae bacterium]
MLSMDSAGDNRIIRDRYVDERGRICYNKNRKLKRRFPVSEKDSRIKSYNEENQYQFFSRQFLADRGVHARCILQRQDPSNPKTVTLPHMHGFFEIELVLSGEGTHIINTDRYPLSPGVLYLIRPGDVHQYIFRDEPVLMCTVQFDATAILPALVSEASLADTPLQCDAGEDREVLAGILRIIIAQENTQSEYAKGLLRCQIEILTRYILEHVPHGEITYSPLVREALSFISIHYYKKLTLEMLSRQLSVSPEHLGRVFKTEMGCGIPEYVNQYRLRIAVNLMRSTRYTMRQISAESGYASYRHFAREFSLYYGMAPAEFRNTLSL